MSTDASFDVSLDYNTLVTEIDAIVDINDKCYELLAAICDASEATSLLESGYLLVNAFNTVDEVINGPIRNTLMHITDVESLFNIFQNQDFYTDYFSNVDADGDGNPDIDYNKLITVMVSLVNTQEECFQLVENYDEVLERYSVMLRNIEDQISYYEQFENVDLNSFDHDYIVQQIGKQNEALTNLTQLRSEYAELANIMATVKNIRDYTYDKGFFLFGGDENFESLSSDANIRIASYKMVQTEDYLGSLAGDERYMYEFEFYDSDGNLLTGVSDIEASIYFAKNGLYTTDANRSGNMWEPAQYSRSYSYLNDQELKIANYLYNSGNFDKLEEFLEFKENYANAREGAMLAQEFISKIDGYYANALTDSQKNLAYTKTLGLLAGTGFVDGWCSFAEGFENLVTADGKISVEQYKTMEIISALNSNDENAIGRLFDNNWQTLGATGSYEIFNSIGNMAPSMIVGAITKCPQLGSALMGISAAGNAREQGLQAGMSDLEAWQYGILSGASESVTEFVLGGIPFLSSADELTDLLKNPIINKMIDANPNMLKFFNSGLYRFGENMASEGIEEMFQTGILEPTINLLVTGEMSEVTLGEVLKSGIYGSISSGITQGTVNTGKGILNLAVNHTLTNGPTIILDDNSYSMKNMSEEFITDFVKKYGNQDLEDPTVLAQAEVDLAPYILGRNGSNQESHDTSMPKQPIRSKIPSSTKAKTIVETAKAVIEKQGGTSPVEVPVVQGKETIVEESVGLGATTRDETTFEHKDEIVYEPIVSQDNLTETPVIVEEKTTNEVAVDVPVVSEVMAENLSTPVGNELTSESSFVGNTEGSSDIASGIAVSGLATAALVSQETMNTKVNGEVVIDAPDMDEKIELDDGSNTVTSEFDLEDESHNDGVLESTINIENGVVDVSTEKQDVAASSSDEFSSNETDDSDVLRPGESLASRIGIQFFATPKTNSGTVVDGISTDMKINAEDATGTISDAITVDSENGEVSVNTTTSRNILVDGKNFVVKMSEGIKNFVAAKKFEIFMIDKIRNRNSLSEISELSDNVLKFISPKLIIQAINKSCLFVLPEVFKSNFDIIYAFVEKYFNYTFFLDYKILNEIDYSVFSSKELERFADMVERKINVITCGVPNSNLEILFDYVINNYDGENYPNLMNVAVCYCSREVFEQNIVYCDSILRGENFNLMDGCPNYTRISEIIISNPKEYSRFNVGRAVECNGITISEARVADIYEHIRMDYIFNEKSPKILVNYVVNTDDGLSGFPVHAMYYCDGDVLENYLNKNQPILNNTTVNYLVSSGSPNASIIADYIIMSISKSDSNITSKYQEFVPNVVDYCSSKLLKENISRVLEVLKSYRYRFNPNSPNASIIADNIIINAPKYQEFVPNVVDYCSSKLLKENISGVLEALKYVHFSYSRSSNWSYIADRIIEMYYNKEDFGRLVYSAAGYCSKNVFVASFDNFVDLFINKTNIPSEFLYSYFNYICNLKISYEEAAEISEYMGDLKFSTIMQNPECYYELFNRLKYSNSFSLKLILPSLLPKLLTSANPIDSFNKIESIFEKNSIPFFGKQFMAFKVLYPEFTDHNYNFGDSSRMSPQLKDSYLGRIHLPGNLVRDLSLTEKRFIVVYNDLLRVAIKSNNPLFREYLMNIDRGNSIFLDISSGYIEFENLTFEQKHDLKIFTEHLEVLYSNTKKGKKDSIDFSKFSLEEKLKYLAEKFKPNSKYDLRDKIVTHFAYSAGYTRFDDIIRDMDLSIREADSRGRKYASELGTYGHFMFEEGDFVRAFSSDLVGVCGSLDIGNFCKEFVTLIRPMEKHDTTPLDIDITMIDGINHDKGSSDFGKKADTLYQSIKGTATGFNFGNFYYIIRKDNPNFNVTRDQYGNLTDTVYDPTKVELFGTHVGIAGAEMHWGARTGISMTDVDYILYKRSLTINERMPYDKIGDVNYDGNVSVYDYDLSALKFEIARHGFYMPVIDFSGKLIFTVEEYDALRSKMAGLSHYGVDEYSFSEKLDIPNVTEFVSKLAQSLVDTQVKRGKIENLLQTLFSNDFGFIMYTERTCDLIPGAVELIDTGSTGRGTNLIGGGDFDFLLRIDEQLFVDKEKLSSFKNAIKDLLCSLPYNEKDSRIDISKGDFRLKGVQIDSDTVVDIDISIAVRTEKIEYSSDECLKDRLRIMEKENPLAYRYAIANIIEAKRVLKAGEVYKKAQNGMGGIGIENWILQHGGSFVEAAESFVRAALGNDWRTSGVTTARDFDAFKSEYSVWDFGQNHFNERENPGSYLFDEYIDCNMSNDGYRRMVEVLRTYLLDYYDSDYVSKDILNMSNEDGHSRVDTSSSDSEMYDGELLQPGEIFAKKVGIQFFGRHKEAVVDIDGETQSLDLDIVVDDGSETMTSEFDLEVEAVDENTDTGITVDTASDEDDGYKLRPGESLSSRIGIQFFATPKTNSGTVVDGISTDISVQAQDATGTVTDAIVVDDESGDVNVDIITPRNIFVDGKNFVVKLCTGVRDFVNIRIIDFKLALGKNINITNLVDSLSELSFENLVSKLIERGNTIEYDFSDSTPSYVKKSAEFILLYVERGSNINIGNLFNYGDLSVLSKEQMKRFVQSFKYNDLLLDANCPSVLKSNADFIMQSVENYLEKKRYSYGNKKISESEFFDIVENADLSVLSEEQLNKVIDIMKKEGYVLNEKTPSILFDSYDFISCILSAHSYYTGKSYDYPIKLLSMLSEKSPELVSQYLMHVGYIFNENTPDVLRGNFKLIVKSLENVSRGRTSVYLSLVDTVLSNSDFSNMSDTELIELISKLEEINYKFNDSTPSVLANFVLNHPESFSKFGVKDVMLYCDSDILSKYFETKKPTVESYFSNLFFGKNGMIVADYVISNGTNHSLVGDAVNFCSESVLRDNLGSILLNLGENTILTGVNARIIVDYVTDILLVLNIDVSSINYKHDVIWSNLCSLVVDAINNCDSSLLTDDVLNLCIPFYDEISVFSYSIRTIIANFVVQNSTKVKLHTLVSASSWCDPNLLTDDIIDKILPVLNSNGFKISSGQFSLKIANAVVVDVAKCDCIKYSNLIGDAIGYCDSSLLTESILNKTLSILFDFNKSYSNADIIARTVLNNPNEFINLIVPVAMWCNSSLLTYDVLQKILPVLNQCDYSDSYYFISNTPLIAGAVINDVASCGYVKYPNLLRRIIHCCGSSLSDNVLQKILPVLDKFDDVFTVLTRPSSVIVHTVFNEPTKFPNLLMQIVSSCDACLLTEDVLKKLLPVLSDNGYVFYGFNSKIIANVIIRDFCSSNSVKYPNLVVQSIEHCDYNLLIMCFEKIFPNIEHKNFDVKNIKNMIVEYLLDNCSNNLNFINYVMDNYNIEQLSIEYLIKLLEFAKLYGYKLNINSPFVILDSYSKDFVSSFLDSLDVDYRNMLGSIINTLGYASLYFEGYRGLFSYEVISVFGIDSVCQIFKYVTLTGVNIDFEGLVSSGELLNFKLLYDSIFDVNYSDGSFDVFDFKKFCNKYLENIELFKSIILNGFAEEDVCLLKRFVLEGFNIEIKSYEDLKKYDLLVREYVNDVIKNGGLEDIRNVGSLLLFNKSIAEMSDFLVSICDSYRMKLLALRLDAVDAELLNACSILLSFFENNILNNLSVDHIIRIIDRLNNFSYAERTNILNLFITCDRSIKYYYGKELNKNLTKLNEILSSSEKNIRISEKFVGTRYSLDGDSIGGILVDYIEINSNYRLLQHTLNAYGPGGKLLDFLKSRVVGQSYICLSLIGDDKVGVKRDARDIDHVTVLFDSIVPRDLLLCKHLDLYSRTKSQNDIEVYASRGVCFNISDILLEKTPLGYHNEYTVYRDHIKPAGILVTGVVPVRAEIDAAATLGVPLVKIKYKHDGISFPNESGISTDLQVSENYGDLFGVSAIRNFVSYLNGEFGYIATGESPSGTIKFDTEYVASSIEYHRVKNEEIRKILAASRKISDVLVNSDGPRKIAIITDAHALFRPTLAALDDARNQGVSEFYSLGDNIGFGPNPSEVLQLLENYGVVSIMGNHEQYVSEGVSQFRPHFGTIATYYEAIQNNEFLRSLLSENQIKSFETYSKFIELSLGGKKLLLVHSVKDYNTGQVIIDSSKYDLVIQGHEHFEDSDTDIRTVRGLGIGGTPGTASYIILEELEDGSGYKLEVREVAYDIEKQKSDILSSDLSMKSKDRIIDWISVDRSKDRFLLVDDDKK